MSDTIVYLRYGKLCNAGEVWWLRLRLYRLASAWPRETRNPFQRRLIQGAARRYVEARRASR